MKKKIILLLFAMLLTTGIVCADDNDTGEDLAIEDSTNYITPSSISNNAIKFSDGFTGFAIDPSKNTVKTSDKFVLSSFSGNEMENNVKLAIIECYKQKKEDAIGNIISQIDNKDSGNDVLKAVFGSHEKIGDTAVVNISNDTEATFNFEFLKSADDETSNCVAYTVSLKTLEPVKEPASEKTNDNKDKKTDKNKVTKTNEKTKDVKTAPAENKTNKTAENNKTDAKKTKTNKTVVNKTTTTTTTTTTTVKENNDTDETPKKSNGTPEDDVVSNAMHTAGNPIFILVIVAVIAIIAVIIYRKD